MKSNKPLPKGLTKKSTPAPRPTAPARANVSSSSVGTGKVNAAKPTAAKKLIETAPDDEDWGDAWG